MKVPPQTEDIFRILSRGQFISSNSADRQISDLYKIIDSEDNFELLYDYFKHIGFLLERGDEYFYFTRAETKVNIETKIRRAYEWIDILDFLKTFDNAFGVGYRFTPSDILVRLKTDVELETKLEALSKLTGKMGQHEILDKILKRLSDDTFIELENELTRQYKVLASFKYLEEFIMTINIPEETIHEIPE